MEGKDVKQGMEVNVGDPKPGWNLMRDAHLRGRAKVMGPSGTHEGCWVLIYGSGLMHVYHPSEFEPVS